MLFRAAEEGGNLMSNEETNKFTFANRRRFLGQLSGAAALAAGALTAPSRALAASSGSATPDGTVPPPAGRMKKSMDMRMNEAIQDAAAGPATNVNNGDEALYPDKGGSFTKGLPHNQWGQVDLNAYASLKTALPAARFPISRRLSWEACGR
ncbi:MAG: hypothetical protein ACLP59_25715 [Bryobacteraceae bacterium]